MMKRSFLVVLIVGMGALGASGAHGGVMSQSVLEIGNFMVLNPDASVLNVTQLDRLTFNDSSLAVANLNGVMAPGVLNQNSLGTLDLPQVCVGACAGFAQNDYSHRAAPGTIDVARADTLLHGAPLINAAGVPTPTDAHVVNEAQLTSGFGFGNVQSNLGLTAALSFSLTNSQALTFSVASLSYLIASVDPADSGVARASEGWTLEIRDSAGAEVFSWSPDGAPGGIVGGVETTDPCDLQHTVNANLPGQTSIHSCAGVAKATTGILDADDTYTLGLRHQGDADVTRTDSPLPEPSSVVLLGLGLAGLRLVRRRRAQDVTI